MNNAANSKYDASRALNELDARRESDDYVSTTVLLPKLVIPETDDTVPMLPALLRTQAE